MRRSLALATPILAAALLAVPAVAQAQGSAPVLNGTWKSTDVLVNDQILSRGVVVAAKSDGTKIEDVYVPLAAFATALNGTSVLEPSLQLNGSTLLVVAISRSDGVNVKQGRVPSSIGDVKQGPRMGGVKYKPHAAKFYDPIKASDASSKDAAKMTVNPIGQEKLQGIEMTAEVTVHSAGVVSRDVRMFGGKAFVPMKDIAHVFGGKAQFRAGRYQIDID